MHSFAFHKIVKKLWWIGDLYIFYSSHFHDIFITMLGKCDLPTLPDKNEFHKFMTFSSQCHRIALCHEKLDAARNLLILKSMKLSSKCDENVILEKKMSRNWNKNCISLHYSHFGTWEELWSKIIVVNFWEFFASFTNMICTLLESI